jgi:hypothetical protein
MPGSEKNKKTLLIVQKAQKRIITLRIFLIRLKYAIYSIPVLNLFLPKRKINSYFIFCIMLKKSPHATLPLKGQRQHRLEYFFIFNTFACFGIYPSERKIFIVFRLLYVLCMYKVHTYASVLRCAVNCVNVGIAIL